MLRVFSNVYGDGVLNAISLILYDDNTERGMGESTEMPCTVECMRSERGEEKGEGDKPQVVEVEKRA